MNKIRLKKQFNNHWDKALIQMGKLGEQKHLAALRDSFAMLVPVVIAASFGIILSTFVFGGWDAVATSLLGWIGMLDSQVQHGEMMLMVGPIKDTYGNNMMLEILQKNASGAWETVPVLADSISAVVTKVGLVKDAAGTIVNYNTITLAFNPGSAFAEVSSAGHNIGWSLWNGVMDRITIIITIGLSYTMARILGSQFPVLAAIVGLASYFTLAATDGVFGAANMFSSIIISIASVTAYCWLEKNKKLAITLPDGVPPAVARSFSKLLPAVIVLMSCALISGTFIIIGVYMGYGWPFWSITQAISSAIQSPFIGLATGSEGALGIGVLYAFMVTFLWFFGLHGQNVLMGIFNPIFTVLQLQNADYIAAGGLNNTIGLLPSSLGGLDAFLFFGGTGATLALILSTFVFSRRSAAREISKYALGPAVFNINEPILFGYPVIANFLLLIPFSLGTVLLFVFTHIAIAELKIVPPAFVGIPWTSPVGIGAFLATQSWQGVLLAFFNLFFMFAFYTPFVLYANRSAKKNGEELVKLKWFNKNESKKVAIING